ncbi:MAG: alpha/beta hydrolase [Ktedonobacterales bacterium]|nr:alpha/beta hydrolase [Ktedonobacterales bacterium]
MTQDILLAHGAWHGSWVYKKLTPLLIAQGFRVHTPTLVGMGETATVYRHHPYSKLGVDDHVRQLEDYIRLNGLEQPYLVGHSYAGAVLNGVLNDMGSQIRGALFLDALFFIPGLDFAHLIAIKDPPAWIKPWYRQVLRNVLLNRPVPPPPVEFMGLATAEDREFVAARMSLLPSRLLDGRRVMPPPMHPHLTYVRCTGGNAVMRELMAPYARYAQEQGWRYAELSDGHDCMLDDPAAVAGQIGAAVAAVLGVPV